MKKSNKQYPVILDAFIESINEYHTRSRKETNPKTVINPHYWEQGKFISLDKVDRYGNIIYSETQPGTTIDFEYHIIGIAFPYKEYKPFHDKWVIFLNRKEKLKRILTYENI